MKLDSITLKELSQKQGVFGCSDLKLKLKVSRISAIAKDVVGEMGRVLSSFVLSIFCQSSGRTGLNFFHALFSLLPK